MVAITGGILLSHWTPFTVAEAAWPAAAFCALWVICTSPWAISRSKHSRWLVWTCGALTLISVGALTEAWHRPGSAPEIDAGSREIVLLDGCVVDPTVFSPEREQFTLELADGARARVSLAIEDADVPLAPLHYGQ